MLFPVLCTFGRGGFDPRDAPFLKLGEVLLEAAQSLNLDFCLSGLVERIVDKFIDLGKTELAGQLPCGIDILRWDIGDACVGLAGALFEKQIGHLERFGDVLLVVMEAEPLGT